MTHDTSGVINSSPMFFDESGIVDFMNFELYLEKLGRNGVPKLLRNGLQHSYPIFRSTEVDLFELHRILKDVSKKHRYPMGGGASHKASTSQLRVF